MFWCAERGIGSVSSGMVWGAHWGGRLGACTGWNDMFPSGSTLGSGAGATPRVASGVYTLGGGVGDFCCCNNVVITGSYGGGVAIFRISANCFKDAVCLFTSVVSGIVGVGLRGACISSTATFVSFYYDEILDN